MRNKRMKILSCTVFGALYLLVSIISLICSTYFFRLAHTGIMSWALAIGFELGAMSCLLSTMVLPRNKQGLVWVMFVILTLFQCMGNMYAAYISLDNYMDWIDMFGLNEMEEISQKRVLAGISGIILPLVALGFIRIMADMLQNNVENEVTEIGADKSENEIVEKASALKYDEEKPWKKEDSEQISEDAVSLPSVEYQGKCLDDSAETDAQMKTDIAEEVKPEIPEESKK